MSRQYLHIEVAVYKGDDMVCMGSIYDCAMRIGVQPRTLYWYLMPTYQKRLAKRKSTKNARMVVRV